MGKDQYFWRMTIKKCFPPLFLFSGPRQQIKVETLARRHGDDSENSASSSSWSAKCEFELPEAFSSAEDFDSYRSVFSGEAALFAATLLFIRAHILKMRQCNRIDSQPTMLLHTINHCYFTCLFCDFKMNIWHVKVCAYSQKTRQPFNRYILLEQNKHHRHQQSYNWNLSQTHFIEIKLQHKQAPNKANTCITFRHRELHIQGPVSKATKN